jgi:hypothetical protein
MANHLKQLLFVSILFARCVRHAAAGSAIPNYSATRNLPASTLIPTATILEPTETITPSIVMDTQVKIFQSARVYSTGYFTDQVFTVVLEFDQPLKGNYRAELEGEKYECVGQELFPNRLYCSGKPIKLKMGVSLVIYSIDNNVEVYRTKVDIPEEN